MEVKAKQARVEWKCRGVPEAMVDNTNRNVLNVVYSKREAVGITRGWYVCCRILDRRKEMPGSDYWKRTREPRQDGGVC